MKPALISAIVSSVLLWGISAGCSPSASPVPSKTSQATLESLLRAVSPTEADYSHIRKIGTSLQSLLEAYLSGADVAQAAKSLGLQLSGGKNVLVDVYATQSVSEVASQLQGLGMDVRATNQGAGVVEGALPIDQLPAVARLDTVRAVVAVTAFKTNKTP